METGKADFDYDHTWPILVLKERKIRYVIAAKLSGETAIETAGTIRDIFRRLIPEIRKSITFDTGGEPAKHKRAKEACEMSTWFCDTYALGKKVPSKTSMAACDETDQESEKSTK